MDMKQDWHLDKGISISHLLTTIGLVVGAVWAFADLSTRLAVLENQFTQINQRVIAILEGQRLTDSAQDIELQQFRVEMRQDVRDIQQKLDRLIETINIR